MATMPRPGRTSIVALVAVLLALFFNWPAVKKSADLLPRVRGQTNTVLFFALAESGQINVQLATAQALLEKHPNVEVHFASFPQVSKQVARVSSFARRRNPSVHEITFHAIPGPDRTAGMKRQLNCTDLLECLAHPPGARGSALLATQLELALWPWSGEEYLALYENSIDIIQRVDPTVAVVDFVFRPALDAIEHLNRVYSIITPLALADIFAISQPWGSGLWKYPALGTGFPFPVPWHLIPENIYVHLRLLYNVIFHPNTGATMRHFRERGIDSNPLAAPHPSIPFITQTLPGASLPLEVVPESVTCAGVIFLDSAPAAEQDPELTEWVQRAPTVVVNLGSLFKYTQERAVIMAKAIRAVLVENPGTQVLWKMAGNTADFGASFTEPLAEELRTDRVRIMDWLTIDTLPLLQTNNIIASVHHGGSSSFNEAVAAGVPQVVIPLWEDHYNFAQLVEDLGLGMYATRETAPEWTVSGISKPISQLLDQSSVSAAKRRAEALRVRELAQKNPGRYVAAEVLAKLASF